MPAYESLILPIKLLKFCYIDRDFLLKIMLQLFSCVSLFFKGGGTKLWYTTMITYAVHKVYMGVGIRDRDRMPSNGYFSNLDRS